MPRKTLLVLSIALNIAFVLFFIGKRIYWTYLKNPASYPFTPQDYMVATAELQSHLPIDSNSIVFVGNSLTSNFQVYEFFPGMPVRNRGIGSNQTTHILQRIKGIAECGPKMIFIEGGINDLAANRSVDSVLLVYKQIIETIRQASPTTKVIVQSTLPVCGTSAALMPAVNKLNGLLNEYAGEDYLDIGTHLLKDGELNKAYTWDGIHLNYEGYKIWAGVVRSHFPYSFSISESRKVSSRAFR